MPTPYRPDSEWPAEAGQCIATARIARSWTDHNGHMNLAAYLMLFDRSFARFCEHIGIGPKQLEETSHTIFVAETHLVYRHELAINEQVGIGLRVLALGPHKMHSYLSMVRLSDRQIVCINEKIDLCVDLRSRRVCAFPQTVATRLQDLSQRESTLPRAEWAGRRVDMSPTRPA